MRIELNDEERAALEAEYFRVELWKRELDNVYAKYMQAQEQLRKRLRELLKTRDLEDKSDEVRPVFVEFRLQHLEIRDETET